MQPALLAIFQIPLPYLIIACLVSVLYELVHLAEGQSASVDKETSWYSQGSGASNDKGWQVCESYQRFPSVARLLGRDD